MTADEVIPAQSTAVLTEDDGFFRYVFHAMATPCELKIWTSCAVTAKGAGQRVEAEAARIESKFSGYRPDSVISAINRAAGSEMELDDETAQLIDFAATAHEASGGLFDITSGVLRRAWRFDGHGTVASDEQVTPLLALVGWDRVYWRRPVLKLKPGMEIDFGGLAKEYAVDQALELVRRFTPAPALVNFGGDLRVTGPYDGGRPWRVAIESVEATGTAAGLLELASGALATSGDSRRFIVKDGKRYGHILDPRSGKPVEDPPRSVTVAAPSCVEAGMIATMAILQGRGAEEFLKAEGVKAWCIR